ncbi:DNA-binding protein H-NS [Tahibacter aquaticus]|jgi:DNA-binding protein H-NS|uniref:DNA-binding protein H-NS n=1 Tax=Tahibacter aquaticus TaxID=520092 RepID=A0A4R6Z4A8_9GAMM|nr:H-NS histone family protein [Tahibacter aquaticus]TDR46515.1 DNA-binding protein H-NS [Tahibacter aquaticus]
MAIDLDSLSPKQLSELIHRANQRQHEIQRERAAEVREKILALAHKEGFTIDQLFGARPAKRRVKPKYRNPAAPDETWTGRGKQPRWFSAALRAGKKEQELLIG